MPKYNCKIIMVDISKDSTCVELTSAPEKKDSFADVLVPMYKENTISSVVNCLEYFMIDDPDKDPCVHIIFDKNDERSGICVATTWMSEKEKQNAN